MYLIEVPESLGGSVPGNYQLQSTKKVIMFLPLLYLNVNKCISICVSSYCCTCLVYVIYIQSWFYKYVYLALILQSIGHFSESLVNVLMTLSDKLKG